MEYADGTNPKDINSALYFLNITASGGSVGTAPDLAKYPRGSSVTLTSTPDSGNSFLGWSGSLSGNVNPQMLTMNADKVVIAYFGMPLATALDTSGLDWTVGGNGVWFSQTATTHDGIDAAQSGVIANSQETWIETTVTGPGNLAFWWKVSSQSGGDFLEFYIDGVLQTGRITGTVNWVQKTYPLTSGIHTLRWRHAKDGNTVAGSDAGWVDEVIWEPAAGYSTWASTQFSAPQLADPLISGPLADPDQDGLVNLLESVFNLSPLAAGNPILASGTGTAGLPNISTIGSGPATRLRIEYIRRKSGYTSTAEVSASLIDGGSGGWTAPTGIPVVTSIDTVWERVTVEDTTTGQAKRFGRVNVTTEL